MILGLEAVDEITPNAGPDARSLTGKSNLGVLVRLKNSARNCRLLDSVTGKFRWIPKSRLRWLGPRSMPTPQLPKSVPSLITGGGAKAFGLKYPLSRVSREPDEAGFAPVHSPRLIPTKFPYTEPAVLSTTVMGRPDCRTDRTE